MKNKYNLNFGIVIIGYSNVDGIKRLLDSLDRVDFGNDELLLIFSIDYSGKIALVIGNEGSGMSKLVKNACDFIAKIPMYGTTNSLNASVASGIMIYEVIRNRK